METYIEGTRCEGTGRMPPTGQEGMGHQKLGERVEGVVPDSLLGQPALPAP